MTLKSEIKHEIKFSSLSLYKDINIYIYIIESGAPAEETGCPNIYSIYAPTPRKRPSRKGIGLKCMFIAQFVMGSSKKKI